MKNITSDTITNYNNSDPNTSTTPDPILDLRLTSKMPNFTMLPPAQLAAAALVCTTYSPHLKTW